MTDESVPPSEFELHALIDGELTRAREAEVARFVEANPEIAARLALLRADKAAMTRLATILLALPVSDRLSRAARYPPAWTMTRRVRWSSSLVSAAIAASLAFVLLLHQGGPSGGDPLIAQAAAARDGRMHPARRVEFPTKRAASAGDKVVSAELGSDAHAPDLGRVGFSLVAVDVYTPTRGHILQLRYRDRQGRLFTVFVRPGHGVDRFALAEHHGTRFCVWENEDLSVVMAGTMPVAELFRLASLVYTSLAL